MKRQRPGPLQRGQDRHRGQDGPSLQQLDGTDDIAWNDNDRDRYSVDKTDTASRRDNVKNRDWDSAAERLTLSGGNRLYDPV